MLDTWTPCSIDCGAIDTGRVMQADVLRPRRVARFALAAMFAAGLLLGVVRQAAAQVGSDRYSAFVIDAQSGDALVAANPDEPRYPASLTKLMTIYLLFEALRDHRLSLTDYVPVSAAAASMPPTKLGLLPGMSVTIEQALLGLVTKSANDAAAALGELMGGTEEQFAQMMTLRAHALGMPHTQFRNASGLPDWDQVTTARDLAVLARHLVQDFPQYYHYFSTPYFLFHGRAVYNHQRLLQSYPGADGLKTGYIEASGYNMVTSAVHGNVRLIGVVLGASNGWERDVHMAALLDQGFTRMGVPVEVARREPPRLPFIGSAQAAPLPPRYAPNPVQVAESRPPRWRPARAATESRAPALRYPPEPRPVPDRYELPYRPRGRDLPAYQPVRVPPPVARRSAPADYEDYAPRPARAATRTAHSPYSWYHSPG